MARQQQIREWGGLNVRWVEVATHCDEHGGPWSEGGYSPKRFGYDSCDECDERTRKALEASKCAK